MKYYPDLIRFNFFLKFVVDNDQYQVCAGSHLYHKLLIILGFIQFQLEPFVFILRIGRNLKYLNLNSCHYQVQKKIHSIVNYQLEIIWYKSSAACHCYARQTYHPMIRTISGSFFFGYARGISCQIFAMTPPSNNHFRLRRPFLFT